MSQGLDFKEIRNFFVRLFQNKKEPRLIGIQCHTVPSGFFKDVKNSSP